MVLFILILKKTELPNILASKKNKNNNKISEFDINNNNNEKFARQLRKLKSKKLFKFKKLLKKNLSKIIL